MQKDYTKIDEVELAEEGTLMAKFQKDRTDAISAMFDRDNRCGTIHTTSQFFVDLDKSVKEIISLSEQSLLERVEKVILKKAREIDYADRTEYDELVEIIKNL